MAIDYKYLLKQNLYNNETINEIFKGEYTYVINNIGGYSLEDFNYALIKSFDDNLPRDFYGPLHMFYSYSRYELEKVINNIKG